MSYNKLRTKPRMTTPASISKDTDNTRHSGRYNTPGQFVSGGEQMQHQPQQFGQTPRGKLAPPPPPPPQLQQMHQNMQQDMQQMPIQQDVEEDMDMKQEFSPDGEQGEQTRPAWMKSRIPGMKKISKKEKRRRQNEHLRRLLTPKNALMALNEMLLHEQVTNQFKVEPAENAPFFKSQNKHTFRADLTLDGQNYKGYGENKLTARNAAAEQALRDVIIKRLAKAYSSESNGEGSQSGENDEETLPMIQIASFALHKLFSEWEYDGHKVPQLKPPTGSISESESADVLAPSGRAPSVKKAKELPLNASAMHPCMLLTYMRPSMEYRELAVEGDRPQNMTFTMGVEVDGSTYVGKAANKKEARKSAAKAACQALFGVKFDDVPTANAPVAAPLADN